MKGNDKGLVVGLLLVGSAKDKACKSFLITEVENKEHFFDFDVSSSKTFNGIYLISNLTKSG